MFSLVPCIRHVPIFTSAAIIPCVFQHSCAVTIDVIDGSGLENGNVIRCDANMGTEILVSLVDCKIVLISQIIDYAPKRCKACN
jgi:hypothetical protein